MCARVLDLLIWNALHAVSLFCNTLAGSVVFLVTVQCVVLASACISGFTDLAARQQIDK